jgi:excisionase family DNA binding protein
MVAADAKDAREQLVADGLLGIEDARKFLSCSRSTLYGLMDSGKIKFLKVGRNRRIPRRALLEFASAQLVGA